MNTTHDNRIIKTKDFQTIAEVFKQVGDASRVRIFWILCHHEKNVTELADMVEMTTPAVSHHLKQLRYTDLIVSRRHGKEVYYKAADTLEAQMLHEMIEKVMEISCENS